MKTGVNAENMAQSYGNTSHGKAQYAGYAPSDQTVSPEALGFLSAVGVFVILMLILFLYVNKKLCFENVGDLSCMDEYRTGKDLKGLEGMLLHFIFLIPTGKQGCFHQC
ncbi:Synaptotagmin-14 [Acipenser ruthenus]|uniref:Synaptotagmin-14 n=1 Tax=Acipenser ruthenus TaxID=7906 RepID=A0A444U540_ACIRT|nr:Synaptotagmin-14 [Acipenser ruthenus]